MYQRIVASGVLASIEKQAATEYPSEACGVLVKDGEGVRDVAFENIQDKLHRVDPSRFTRTSLKAYNMNSLKLERLKEREELEVIYHSHVECDAYFSEEDQDGALTPDTAEPVMPGVDYLVVSMYDKALKDANLYRYDPATKRYEWVDGTRPPSEADKKGM